MTTGQRKVSMIRRCPHVVTAALALLSGFAVLRAQTAAASAARPEFEVASIKPNKSGSRNASMMAMPGGRLRADNMPTRALIAMAYDVRDSQISGGPGWINNDPYDVTAKAEGNASMAQMRLMMQSLLADRFKLAVHRETKEQPVYELIAAKGGAKLGSTKEGSCITPSPNNPAPAPRPGEKPPVMCGMVRMGRGLIDSAGTSMDRVVTVLSQALGRTVVDKTGYTGMVDFHLTFTPDDATPGGSGPPGMSGQPAPNAPPADQAGPDIFTALQEQMGLKLESAKGPVETLVIDHIERPSEN